MTDQSISHTPLRDAWMQAQRELEEADLESISDAEFDALEQRAEQAREAFLASDEPHLFEIRDCCGSVERISAASLDEARKRAVEWVREGDWDTDDGTIWVKVTVRDLDTDDVDWATVAIDPDEPECLDGDDHDWQSPVEIVGGSEDNPGVSLNGAGVIIEEVCVRCGCGRRTDTYATNLNNGEQGLRSVSYLPGEYREAVEVARRTNEDALADH